MKKTQLAFEDFIIGFLMFFMLASVIFLFINSGAGSDIDFFNTSIYQDSKISLDYLYLNVYEEGSTVVNPSKVKFNQADMVINFSFSRTGLPSGEFDDRLIDFPVNVKVSWLNCSVNDGAYTCPENSYEEKITQLLKYDFYDFSYVFNESMTKYTDCSSNITLSVEFLSDVFTEGFIQNNKYDVPVNFCFFKPLDVTAEQICVPTNPNSTTCATKPLAFDANKQYPYLVPVNFEDVKQANEQGIDLNRDLAAHFTFNEGNGIIVTDSKNNLKGDLKISSSCIGKDGLCLTCYKYDTAPTLKSYSISGRCFIVSSCNTEDYYNIGGTECTVNEASSGKCYYGINGVTGYSTCSRLGSCGFLGWFNNMVVSNQIDTLYENYGVCESVTSSTTTFSQDSKYGTSLSFNGINSYVQIEDSALLKPNELSLSAWVKTEGHDSNFIVEKQKNLWVSYAMRITGDGPNSKAECLIGTDSSPTSYTVASTSNVGNNAWHNIVCTYDGVNLKIYFDGNLEATTYVNNNIYYDGSTGVRIGYHVEPSTYFNGSIDDVRIYNKSLTSLEIKSLYDLNYDWRTELIDYSAYNPYAVKVKFSNNDIKTIGFTLNLTYIKGLNYELYLNKSLIQGTTTYEMFIFNPSEKTPFSKSTSVYAIFDIRDVYLKNPDGSLTNLFSSGKIIRCNDNNQLFKIGINSYEIEMNTINNEFKNSIGWCLNI